MKILYDSNIFDYQKFGGVSKCFCEVLCHFPKSVDYELPIKITKNVHLLQSGLFKDNHFHRLLVAFVYFVKKSFRERPTIVKINREYNKRILQKGNYDVLHHTFSDDYFLPYIGAKPFIYTMHDMIPELYPDMFNMDDHWIKCRKLLCEKAAKIVAISENTKKDLVDIFGIDSEKIVVVHHGGPQKRECNSEPLIDSPYFLYVGSRLKYKNFDTLLHAFGEFSQTHNEYKLICTGRPFTEDEKKIIDVYCIQEKVIQMFVSDNDLLNLYTYAKAFIYPSYYEGFGLPILEAFSCGCPTILSNCSCFPEIGGDAALYFDAKSNGVSELLKQLVYVSSLDDELREDIIQKGYERLKFFTWEASAKKLCKVYESVL